jgi:N-acetylglucosamine-6-sulfatase
MVDKRTMHEPSIRIPLIASGPGLPTGVVEQHQVLTVDLAPSVLELCQAEPLEDIAGRSWCRLVNGGDSDWRQAWFYTYNYERQFPYTPNVRGIRTDGWKFIHYPHGDGKPDRHRAELYDLTVDPEERRNLADDPRHAAKRAELQAQLAKLLAQEGLTAEGDRMPLDEGIKPQLPDQKIR